MKKRYLGYAMVSAPFVAIFGWIMAELGWEAVLFIFGFTAVIVLSIIGGICLIFNESDN